MIHHYLDTAKVQNLNYLDKNQFILSRQIETMAKKITIGKLLQRHRTELYKGKQNDHHEHNVLAEKGKNWQLAFENGTIG